MGTRLARCDSRGNITVLATALLEASAGFIRRLLIVCSSAQGAPTARAASIGLLAKFYCSLKRTGAPTVRAARTAAPAGLLRCLRTQATCHGKDLAITNTGGRLRRGLTQNALRLVDHRVADRRKPVVAHSRGVPLRSYEHRRRALYSQALCQSGKVYT